MSVVPVVRHLIACKKEPTMNGPDPSVHEILYAVRPKANVQYPVWLRPFFLFGMIADGQGICEFQAQLRLVELNDGVFEVETVVVSSKPETIDLGNQPLRVRFLSIQMPPVRLPSAGVYRVYLIVDGKEIGADTLHAR
jgi:hypothetical protein